MGGGKKQKQMTLEICIKRGSNHRIVYGIALMSGGSLSRLPVYPFVNHKERLDALEEFVSLYKEDLITFYSSGHRTDFAHFLYGFNTARKEAFRDEWFKKGVLIY